MHRNVIKTSNFAYRVLLVRRRISQKIYVAFCVPIGCVRFARYCGKIYRRHFFPCGRLVRIVWKRLQADLKYIYYCYKNFIHTYTFGKRCTVSLLNSCHYFKNTPQGNTVQCYPQVQRTLTPISF